MTKEQCDKCVFNDSFLNKLYCEIILNVYEFNSNKIKCHDYIWNGEL